MKRALSTDANSGALAYFGHGPTSALALFQSFYCLLASGQDILCVDNYFTDGAGK